MKYAIIPVEEPVQIHEVETLGLKPLQAAVKGYIEAVHLVDNEACMYVNEEGKLEGLPLNRRANEIAHEHKAIFANDVIVGDVAITGDVDDEGNTTGLSDEWATKLQALPSIEVLEGNGLTVVILS